MSEPSEGVKLEVKRRILAELKQQESLRKEILNDLSPKAKVARFFQHPAMLLVVGFFLTGVLGTGLTAYWQRKEAVRQQRVTARQLSIAQKYELANDIAKAVGDTHAAASGVMSEITIAGERGIDAAALAERAKYWYDVKRAWLTNSDVYLQKLTVHFPANPKQAENKNAEDKQGKNKSARDLFEDVIDERKKVNNKILNLLKELGDRGGQLNDAQGKTASEIVSELNATKHGTARKLMEALAAKIQEESNQ